MGGSSIPSRVISIEHPKGDFSLIQHICQVPAWGNLLTMWTLWKSPGGQGFVLPSVPFGLHGGLFERHKGGKQIIGSWRVNERWESVDHGFKKFGDYKERSKLDGGWWEQRLGRFCILEWKCISLLTCWGDGTDSKGEFEKKRVVLPRWLLLEWKVAHRLIIVWTVLILASPPTFVQDFEARAVCKLSVSYV